MRKWLRSIAKYNMESRGVGRKNKKKKGEKGKDGRIIKTSFFSKNWRKYAAMGPVVKQRRRAG